MNRIHKDLERKDFDIPATVEKTSICSTTGLLPKSGCPTIKEFFDTTTLPTEKCNKHSSYRSYDNNNNSNSSNNSSNAENNQVTPPPPADDTTVTPPPETPPADTPATPETPTPPEAPPTPEAPPETPTPAAEGGTP